MVQKRYELSDEQYSLIKDILPVERPSKQGRPWRDHRVVLNGMFWVLCSGAPWRDLPERYGSWKTVYDRFRRWRQAGVIQKVLGHLIEVLDSQEKIDWELFCIDGSNIRATRDAAGALKKGQPAEMMTLRWGAHVVDSVQSSIY